MLLFAQLVSELLAFYEAQCFFTVFLTACQWTLSTTTQIPSKYSHLTATKSVLVLWSDPAKPTSSHQVFLSQFNMHFLNLPDQDMKGDRINMSLQKWLRRGKL